jgi:Fur family transcriptional regulator, peroxide stress response regulator
MPDPEIRFQRLVTRLRERAYRLTPQRVALLRLIASSEGHPSAAHLYEQIKGQFPTTSLATVYKTLNLLKELGEVLELGFSGDDNRYDGSRPYPHPHLICVRCRTIMDPEVRPIDGLAEEVARRTGYQVLGHRLDFYGLCPDCRDGAQPAPPASSQRRRAHGGAVRIGNSGP